jgi:hypothetical protein
MVFGGWGLVGAAICRKILEKEPSELMVASLLKSEAEEACEKLKRDFSHKTKLIPIWGNIFLRDSLQGLPREELIEISDNRIQLIEDVLGELTEDILSHSHLFQLIQKYEPDIVIDSINTATALAYQDVFLNYYRVRKELRQAKSDQSYSDNLINETEKLLCTLYIPQLIRHAQILHESMRRVNTKIYIKIGTSGTGGMGLNIPYTHSEEKPSRVLLSKSSVAGAHSLLLFLMARTPEGPIIKEVKPAAAIAWKRIEYGEVKKGGKPVELFDCPLENAYGLENEFHLHPNPKWNSINGKTLKSVFIDTGENGIFSKGEFTAITRTGQMEFVTPEEIASTVVYEIHGANTGHDIINALDNAIMGPTYRAGYMRHAALQLMEQLEKKHQVDSVAFELLGPPRLSKLLYEVYLLKQAFKTMDHVRNTNESILSQKLEQILSENEQLRSQIISIGIPILLSDGKRLLRGPVIKIPPFRGSTTFELTDENIDHWAHDGWIDLRIKNMRIWKDRIQLIFKEIELIPSDETSSRFEHDKRYWLEDKEINIGKVVGWIFTKEEKGLRMKS